MTTGLKIGTLLITPNAQANLDPADVLESVHRHSIGDWGDLDDKDMAENELSLEEGFRILSAYADRNDNKFWGGRPVIRESPPAQRLRSREHKSRCSA